MLTDLYYDDKNQPVMVVGQTAGDRSRSGARRGHLSRQDSRNFRSSRSPPPSRSNNHASSWFGHRNSSQSPPRSRSQMDYSDYRRSKYGRSPERSKRSWFGLGSRKEYREGRSHTMYRDDYAGYDADYGYGRDGGGYRTNDGYSGHVYASSAPYASSDIYHGEHSSVVPRTYQTTYGAANVYNKQYAETVKLKVPLCCQACEERITNYMLTLEGVDSVTCDQMKQKVTVRGTASPAEVLRQARECFRQARFW